MTGNDRIDAAEMQLWYSSLPADKAPTCMIMSAEGLLEHAALDRDEERAARARAIADSCPDDHVIFLGRGGAYGYFLPEDE